MIVRIKKGARLFRDFKFPRWGLDVGRGEVDRPFKAEPCSPGRVRLTAFGYGLMTSEYGEGSYGCGAVYCREDDIEVLDCDLALVYKPIDTSKPARMQKLCDAMKAELNKLGCHKFDEEVTLETTIS